MAIVPKHEGITGASLSGSDGTQNRTYVLTNSDAVLEQMQFIIEGAILQTDIDFTFDTDLNTVTFLNNVWDDQNISLDYFIDSTTSTTEFDTDRYSFLGADLTGTDGGLGRVFTMVTNKAVVSEQMQVIVENNTLQIGIDYTFNIVTKNVIFLNSIFDNQNITVDFLFTKQTFCATTLQVARYSGLGVQIELETLGTGDNSNKSFDTESGNIIENSHTVYFGATGANNLGILIENVDYQLALDDGRLFLFETGKDKIETDILYISYTNSSKQSDTVLVSYLPAANGEVERLTNNYWGPVKSNTQFFDGYTHGYPQTDRPFGEQIDDQPEFELSFKSIQSVESIEFLDFTGTVSGFVDPQYIRFDPDGRVLTGPSTIPNGKRNVLISFTHGYAEIPAQIQELCALITGLIAFVNISGGSFKDVSTYTLGRKTFSIGQVYVNIRESIDQMKSRIDSILDDVGYRYAIA